MATLRCSMLRIQFIAKNTNITIIFSQLTIAKFSSTNSRQSIRDLSNQFEKDNIKQNRILIQSAFDIYKQQNMDSLIINDMLKMCIKFKSFSNYLLLWKDIENISTNSSNSQSILYSLLLKCCANSFPIDINKCIQTLQWIKDRKYKIKQSDASQFNKDVNKLLSKGRISNFATLQKIHFLIDGNNDIYVQTSLINQYGKYENGASFAQNIFYCIDVNQINSIALNAMMTAFVQNKQNEKALKLYQEYAHLHDDRSHVLGLKICSNVKNISFGMDIHQKNESIEDIYFQTALINFYGINGMIDKSQNIFAKLIDGNNQINVVCVNAMMKAFMDSKMYQNALKMYTKYEIFTNERSHNMAIKACIKLNETNKAKDIVSRIKANGKTNVQIKNTLIDFYGHCGEISAAQNVYNSIARHERDIVSKNALCSAYLKNNQSEKALAMYEDGMRKDDISHICALKACMQMNAEQRGKDIHSQIRLLNKECSIELKTMLIEFYGYFGDVSMIKNIFDSIRHPNNQCIGVLMTAYSMNKCHEVTLQMYEKYHHLHNEIIHLLAIKACIKCDQFEKGKQIHQRCKNEINQNVQLQNILIDFYGHFDDLLNAEKIFKEMAVDKRDIFSFNSMMNAYFECSEYVKCIDLFNTMNDEIIPDAISFAIAIKACVESTAYHIGFEIDQRLKNVKNANIRQHTSVIINLIELYGKCAKLNLVQNVFNECANNKKNEIGIWNVCIKAFGRNGELAKAKQIFYRMQTETDLIADRKTFLILLNVCNHCGDVDEAQNIWLNMIKDKQIKYDCHIVTTLIDCFVRASKLKQARNLIFEFENYVNNEPYEPMWLSLLNGCKKFNEQNMANLVYDEMKSRFQKKSFVQTSSDS